VALVSLGSLHAGTPSFFRDCVRALSDLPIRLVLATGSATSAEQLGPLPANVLVRRTVPQLDVPARAAVFVTHGESSRRRCASGAVPRAAARAIEDLVSTGEQGRSS
jgi:UDP:flavonoid glycosyltransferase YjiC (YdhE family)